MKTITVKYNEYGKITDISDNSLYFEQENESLCICAEMTTDKSVRAYIKASNNNSYVTEALTKSDTGVYSFTVADAYMSKGTLYVGFEVFDTTGYIERFEPFKVYIDSFVSLGSGSGSNVYVVTVNVGEVETLEPGEDAYVVNTGNQKDMKLNFGIPKGVKGDKGDKGDRGDDGYTPQKGVDYFTPDDIASLNIPSVDQIYTPGSENAQSGKSVAEAVTAEKNRSDITFSNALKGSKSGSAILIDDVSPIEHNMIVRVSSDTLTDLSTVTIYKYGKNLFNLNKVQNATLTTYMNKPCLSYVDGAKFFVYTSNFKEDTQYTFTTKAYREDGVINKPITVTFWYTDGTSRSKIMDAGKIYSITSTAGKTLTKISGNDNYGKKCYIDLSVTQLEIGTTASEYEPYKECVEYTPNADGTVNGVTSLYPSTTLTTDTNGVLIECEYNRDINKAFAELQQAIISLGGNV